MVPKRAGTDCIREGALGQSVRSACAQSHMSHPPCPGPASRREFLRVGTLALGGLGLNHLLAAQTKASQKPADTSLILFWMWGGPSHLETYDLKPDAPSEYR